MGCPNQFLLEAWSLSLKLPILEEKDQPIVSPKLVPHQQAVSSGQPHIELPSVVLLMRPRSSDCSLVPSQPLASLCGHCPAALPL
jgi:hypothetical protein